jgi:flavin reductase (DIM6/NTAB) family NADH-FMN oxidoreductase RutF/NAD(P)-dependent dehydrogenase (short-subunit alcohol dehydrogenase family)
MKLTKDNITALSSHERPLFINSLSGFKSANLVGTADASGHSNLCIVSSVVHLGANPPLLGMVIRPHTVPRGTLENILDTGVYTLNHVHEDIYQQAHQTSARYPEDVSEFDEVGFTEQWDDNFNAPFVQESRIKIGMQFRERHTLGINGTEFIIGEIISIEMADEFVAEDGFVSLEKAGTVAISSLDTYHSTNTLASLSYAQPEKEISLLNRHNVTSPSIIENRQPTDSDPKCVLVIAASGGIGQAYCENIIAQFPDVQLIRMARNIKKLPPLAADVLDIEVDLSNDDSIDNAISALSQPCPIDWIFVASGWLHDDQMKPEKTYRSLTREQLIHAYDINAVGPTLFITRLLAKVDKKHSLKIGVLSARVGSVSDNRLGGWHSYRASKSALNMLIKNIAIECNNTRKPITIVGLQPGTTDTALSAPFQKNLTSAQLQTPEFTAKQLIKVMHVLEKDDSGELFDFEGFRFEP